MKIVRCKCGHLDYYDLSMQLRGGPWCRKCYKQKYKEEYGEDYPYDDIDDTSMPSEYLYEIQQLMSPTSLEDQLWGQFVLRYLNMF